MKPIGRTFQEFIDAISTAEAEPDSAQTLSTESARLREELDRFMARVRAA